MCGGHVAKRLFLETDAYHTHTARSLQRDRKAALQLKAVCISCNSTLQRDSSLFQLAASLVIVTGDCQDSSVCVVVHLLVRMKEDDSVQLPFLLAFCFGSW